MCQHCREENQDAEKLAKWCAMHKSTQQHGPLGKTHLLAPPPPGIPPPSPPPNWVSAGGMRRRPWQME